MSMLPACAVNIYRKYQHCISAISFQINSKIIKHFSTHQDEAKLSVYFWVNLSIYLLLLVKIQSYSYNAWLECIFHSFSEY